MHMGCTLNHTLTCFLPGVGLGGGHMHCTEVEHIAYRDSMWEIGETLIAIATPLRDCYRTSLQVDGAGVPGQAPYAEAAP